MVDTNLPFPYLSLKLEAIVINGAMLCASSSGILTSRRYPKSFSWFLVKRQAADISTEYFLGRVLGECEQMRCTASEKQYALLLSLTRFLHCTPKPESYTVSHPMSASSLRGNSALNRLFFQLDPIFFHLGPHQHRRAYSDTLRVFSESSIIHPRAMQSRIGRSLAMNSIQARKNVLVFWFIVFSY